MSTMGWRLCEYRLDIARTGLGGCPAGDIASGRLCNPRRFPLPGRPGQALRASVFADCVAAVDDDFGAGYVAGAVGGEEYGQVAHFFH